MTCRFCGSIPGADNVLQFVCRLNPPKVFASAFPAGNNQILWASQRYLPVVTGVDWCGKYESEKAPERDMPKPLAIVSPL